MSDEKTSHYVGNIAALSCCAKKQKITFHSGSLQLKTVKMCVRKRTFMMSVFDKLIWQCLAISQAKFGNFGPIPFGNPIESSQQSS